MNLSRANPLDALGVAGLFGTLTFEAVSSYVSLSLVVLATLPLIIVRWRDVFKKPPK
jgi:hypothetical protein